ncbi:MAG: hypothetical protein KDK89_11860, partial [Alphaproteobacteria bacterium]|nr:hypothetical protein [Alphaproteobacteria bacterium]
DHSATTPLLRLTAPSAGNKAKVARGRPGPVRARAVPRAGVIGRRIGNGVSDQWIGAFALVHGTGVVSNTAVPADTLSPDELTAIFETLQE